MDGLTPMVAAATALILAPLAGGLVLGLDRKLTARLQGRYGPPVSQPFYDLVKLFGKGARWVNRWPPFFAVLYAFGAAASVILFALGGDLLVLFFVHTLTIGFLVMGALAAVSPYSRIGAGRELIQAMIYEPLLLVVFMSFHQAAGSFDIAVVRSASSPLVGEIPLAWAALFLVFLIKMRKSPFDFSTAHHAHQELVQGIRTEYSGPFLALVELGHLYEIAFFLLLFSLFWPTAWGASAILAATFAASLLVDNVVPRMTWRWALRMVWIPGLLLVFANMAWIYYGL